MTASVSDIKPSVAPTIHLNRCAETIDIFGGNSGYTEQTPYYIEFRRIRTTSDVSEWLCPLAGKTWFPSSALWALRQTLLGIYEERRR